MKVLAILSLLMFAAGCNCCCKVCDCSDCTSDCKVKCSENCCKKS